MITGKETPDSGSFVVGDTVKLGIVDQDRDNLDGSRSVYDEISNGADFLELGSAQVIIIYQLPLLPLSGIRVFTCFSPPKCKQPVGFAD